MLGKQQFTISSTVRKPLPLTPLHSSSSTSCIQHQSLRLATLPFSNPLRFALLQLRRLQMRLYTSTRSCPSSCDRPASIFNASSITTRTYYQRYPHGCYWWPLDPLRRFFKLRKEIIELFFSSAGHGAPMSQRRPLSPETRISKKGCIQKSPTASPRIAYPEISLNTISAERYQRFMEAKLVCRSRRYKV